MGTAIRGSYTSLRRRVVELRPRQTAEPEIRFETGPGIQTKGHWTACGLWPLGDGAVELYAFVAIFGYSRMLAVRFATDKTRSTTLRSIVRCVDDLVYLERLKQLRAALAATEDTEQEGVPAERAVEWLRALTATWTAADVREAKADLLHAIYERIVVAGRSFVSVRLTTAAYAPGMALALPEKVAMARPTGFGPATFGFGGRGFSNCGAIARATAAHPAWREAAQSRRAPATRRPTG